MEKLIELLNEYVKEQGWLGVLSLEELNDMRNQIYICSKYYEFIKWLVENDKIDLLKLTCMNPRYTEILDSDFSWEDRIVMILSIEENPISFLFSILN